MAAAALASSSTYRRRQRFYHADLHLWRLEVSISGSANIKERRNIFRSQRVDSVEKKVPWNPRPVSSTHFNVFADRFDCNIMKSDDVIWLCGCRWWCQGGGAKQTLPQSSGGRQRLSPRFRLLHPVWMFGQQEGRRAARWSCGILMWSIVGHLRSLWQISLYCSKMSRRYSQFSHELSWRRNFD